MGERLRVLTERNYNLTDHGDGSATVTRYDPALGEYSPALRRQWLPDALFELEMRQNGMIEDYPTKR